MGIPYDLAFMAGNTRRGIWFITGTQTVAMAMSRQRLQKAGFCGIVDTYYRVHVNC